MIVYRVENENGRGPYSTSHDFRHDLIDAHNYSRRHPTPNFPSLDAETIWLCGFASQESLNEWFNGWLEKLTSVGFRVVRYDVPDEFVKNSDIQLIFQKDKAELVKEETF